MIIKFAFTYFKKSKNFENYKKVNYAPKLVQGCHKLRELREFRETQGIFKSKKISEKLMETQGISGNFDLFYKLRETQGSFDFF